MDFGKYVRTVPDFPKKGILFYDLMPLFGSPEAFPRLIEHLAAPYRGQGIAHVVGIEARGFILAAPVACALGAGFVPVRKKGKLPGTVRELSYDLEYGQDTIAVQEGALAKGEKVLLIDDLLATGGTALAAIGLLEALGAHIVESVFVTELEGLGGREKLSGRKIRSILTYQVSE
ncbi:MAG: adenine phosphoribosyltransferase [Leptospirales bacterium]